MAIGKWGVWFAPNRMPMEDIGRLAETVESHGYDALWYPESVAYEAMALGGYYLSRTKKLYISLRNN